MQTREPHTCKNIQYCVTPLIKDETHYSLVSDLPTYFFFFFNVIFLILTGIFDILFLHKLASKTRHTRINVTSSWFPLKCKYSGNSIIRPSVIQIFNYPTSNLLSQLH